MDDKSPYLKGLLSAAKRSGAVSGLPKTQFQDFSLAVLKSRCHTPVRIQKSAIRAAQGPKRGSKLPGSYKVDRRNLAVEESRSPKNEVQGWNVFPGLLAQTGPPSSQGHGAPYFQFPFALPESQGPMDNPCQAGV